MTRTVNGLTVDEWADWGCAGATLDPVWPSGMAVHYPGPGRFVFDSHGSCREQARAWDRMHRDRGSKMLEYGALLCHHGTVLEGRNRVRDPIRRVASQGTTTGNDQALSVQLMRGTGDPPPTDLDLQRLGAWNAFLRENGCGPDVTGHRDWYPTECPGDPLYAALPTIRRYADQELDMPITDDDLERLAHRINVTLGDWKADGELRDPKKPDPEQGNQRIRQIENKIDRVLALLDPPKAAGKE